MAKKNVNKWNPINWSMKKVGAVVGSLGVVAVAGMSGYAIHPNQVTVDDKVISAEDFTKLVEDNKKLVTDNEALVNESNDLKANADEAINTAALSDEDARLVSEYIYDNYGEVSVLTEDLTDEGDIVERVKFLKEIKQAAVDGIKLELFDEIDKEVVSTTGGNVTLDEDDMERLRIDDRDHELSVSVSDWEDRDGSVEVTGTFRQDGVDFAFTADALFESGRFDELDNIVVIEA